jgi:hypothetical protein
VPEPRDVALQGVTCSGRGWATPQGLKQPVGWDKAVGIEKQVGKDCPLPITTEIQQEALMLSLQGPEDPELHVAPLRGRPVRESPDLRPTRSTCRHIISALQGSFKLAVRAPVACGSTVAPGSRTKTEFGRFSDILPPTTPERLRFTARRAAQSAEEMTVSHDASPPKDHLLPCWPSSPVRC